MAPMNPLQVQLFTGMAAGRRARFEQSPITFGRAPDNVLVIEDTQVSRLHGEIRFEAGQWQLYNHSGNGTKLNRKAVKDKPRPIQDGDEVSVGKQLLFSIHIEPVEASAAQAEAPFMAPAQQPGQFGQAGQGDPNAEGGQQPSKKRNKILIGAGIYGVAMLGLIIFLSTLGNEDVAPGKVVPQMKPAEIATMIRRPAPVQPVDDVRYKLALDDANNLFETRDSKPGNLYRCYVAYQKAISHGGLGRDNFKPQHLDSQRRYFSVQDQLISEVQRLYENACDKLNRGDYEGSILAFEDLQLKYGDTTSELYKNAQAKRNVALKAFGDKKIKRKK